MALINDLNTKKAEKELTSKLAEGYFRCEKQKLKDCKNDTLIEAVDQDCGFEMTDEDNEWEIELEDILEKNENYIDSVVYSKAYEQTKTAELEKCKLDFKKLTKSDSGIGVAKLESILSVERRETGTLAYEGYFKSNDEVMPFKYNCRCKSRSLNPFYFNSGNGLLELIGQYVVIIYNGMDESGNLRVSSIDNYEKSLHEMCNEIALSYLESISERTVWKGIIQQCFTDGKIFEGEMRIFLDEEQEEYVDLPFLYKNDEDCAWEWFKKDCKRYVGESVTVLLDKQRTLAGVLQVRSLNMDYEWDIEE